MQYIIAFLEGIITFISPCLLPMLPIYLTYFANGGNDRKRTVKNALGFILGFTVVFVCLGAFAGSVGGLLAKHRTAVNIVSGAVVIIFGLNFAGVFRIGFLNRTKKLESDVRAGFWGSVIFGIVFSIGWTPCVGAFLGSALMLASSQGSAVSGIVMLIVYSLGLGVPFAVSALLLDRLKGTFDFIKKHYTMINRICGIFLIIVGILMATGLIGSLISYLGA